MALFTRSGHTLDTACSTRVKFMLEVLLAIKNNNVAKIPNYDPSHSEHLKKLMKGFLHKGSCVTELRITLDDLLKGNFISFLFCLTYTKFSSRFT